MEARETLKNQILTRPRALDHIGMSGGHLLINLVSSVLSNLNILNADKILLNSILSPTVVFPRNEFDFNVENSWDCLVHLFESA